MKELAERFGESRITFLEIDGEKWIKAADCAKALDYKNYKTTVSQFIETNKELLGSTVQNICTVACDGKKRDQWFFNENGLIAFLIKTNKPKAVPFQRWAIDVLSKELEKTIKNKETDLRKKSKKIRIEFTDTLKAHGYRKPGEYIQTTYLMKTKLGIDKNRPKNDLTAWELCRVAMSEMLSTVRLESSNADGYYECKPIIQASTENIAGIPEKAIIKLED